MWEKSNWCEKIILISLTSIVLLFSYNIFFQKLICNSWLFLYIAITTVITIWIACRDIRFLLEQSAPLKIESDELLSKYPQINILTLLVFLLKRFLTLYISPVLNTVEIKRKPLNVDILSDVSIVANVIEKKCIWLWYSQYVSKEVAFPLACKQLLDQMVTKVFLVSHNIDSIGLYTDGLGVVLKHFKEFKKAKRRQIKIGQGKIEEYYRNSHPTSPQRNSLACTKGKSTQSHCLVLTRSFLKELLPWELWSTPQSLLLASILAKRLDTYITTSLCNPLWLKYRIMQTLDPKICSECIEVSGMSNEDLEEKPLKTGNNTVDDHQGENVNPVVPEIEMTTDSLSKTIFTSETNTKDNSKPTIETVLSNMISSSMAPILQRAELDKSSSVAVLQSTCLTNNGGISKTCSQPINITNSPKKSNEVKVYDKVLDDGDIKTWNNDNDLECVSLGQDLLASLDGDVETRFGRLWEADGGESWSPNLASTDSSAKTSHSLWFGEDENLELEPAEDSPPKHNTNNHSSNGLHVNTMVQNISSHSITNFNLTNPLSMHSMKELQNISINTVNQAKHKIGDLQDEAAGVMEGILDFGIAGLRKGLRFTGLQESQGDKGVPVTKPFEGVSSLTSAIGNTLSRKNSHSEIADHNDKLLARGLNSSNGKSVNSQHLVKQQRITSQDSASFSNRRSSKDVDLVRDENALELEKLQHPLTLAPYLDPVIAGTDSPEYEYEEPADFASTIAKLRHLLQEKASDISPKSQDDSDIPDSLNSLHSLSNPKPTSATQPTNSPVHKVASQIMDGNPAAMTSKSEEIVSSPSVDSDYGFTILSQNSSELVEAEEALNHKIEQISTTNIPQINTNNMQRLDKLFTRTVTGVFNTIKTAVGGDSLADGVSAQLEASQNLVDKQIVVRAHQHKDDWIFVEGEMEVSKVVGKLVMERRGFCVVDNDVEAGQDILEVLGSANSEKSSHTPIRSHCNSPSATSPCVNDDLDESEILYECPLYQMLMELATVIMGGVLQKDAVVKCTSVVIAEIVESILRNKVITLNSWLVTLIIETFHQLAEEETNSVDNLSEEPKSPSLQMFENDELCTAVMNIIPDVLLGLFGNEEIKEAISIIISSLDSSIINRDLIFNLLDVFVLHFVKACSSQNGATPPPSA